MLWLLVTSLLYPFGVLQLAMWAKVTLAGAELVGLAGWEYCRGVAFSGLSPLGRSWDPPELTTGLSCPPDM